MPRRSLKGHVAHCSTGFLRFLNIIVALGAVPMIVVTFVLRPSPTAAGWGVIIVGILALLAGLIGTCTVNQPGCFHFHLLFVLLSMAGMVAFAVIIFVNTNRMMEILEPTITEPNPYTMIQGIGICCAALVVLQLIILVLTCMVNACGLTDFYEDLEAANAGPSASELARQQREEEARRAKIESTSAHQLAVKMKEKYGQYQPKEKDFDVK